MSSESLQHRLDRTRKPRVQITYDVETGGAIQKKELPFVLGVLADLSGNPADPLPKLKEREFVDIQRDNFNEVLKKQKPRVAFKVENKLTGKPDETLSVDLTFESMKDFEPEQVAKKVPALNELLEARQRLRSLMAKAISSDELSDLLKQILTNEETRKAVAKEMGIEEEKPKP